jgi:hypothetical protein
MTKPKHLCGAPGLRIMGIASFLAAVYSFGIGPALADGDGIKDSAKKTERGFGQLLKGIGQEAKKAGGGGRHGVKRKEGAERYREANRQGQGRS